MLEALDRMNIPQKIQAIIKDMYNKATFKVAYEDNESSTKKQHAGIRQGCPLSPFLFILVMTVMFKDIHMNVDRDITNRLVNGTTFAEILYADDTMLVTQDTRSMHRILHAIEAESAYCGLELNKGKCNVIAMNGKNKIKFSDGSELKHESQVTYLGGTITKDVNINTEVMDRIASATNVWRSLDTFWKHTKCANRTKMIIYDAVVKTRLLYGLETVELTKNQHSKLNAFHLKGLRKILKMKTTYIDRTCTNEEVFKRANFTRTRGNTQNPQLQTIKEDLDQKRTKLAKDILKRQNLDPMRSVSFEHNSAQPYTTGHRRRGRPRNSWLQSTLEIMWQNMYPSIAYTGSEAQLKSIYDAAKTEQD